MVLLALEDTGKRSEPVQRRRWQQLMADIHPLEERLACEVVSIACDCKPFKWQCEIALMHSLLLRKVGLMQETLAQGKTMETAALALTG